MKYSVVIATYNRAEDLRATVQSLAALRPSEALVGVQPDRFPLVEA